MSMIRTMALIAVVAFVMGAEKPDVEPAAKLPKASIRGTVTEVGGLRAKDFIGRMLIEGKKEKDTEHEKASVLMKTGTKFYKWNGGKKVEAKFSDVVKGCKVQCVFVGPVAESFPVQARTEEVIILESPKK